MTPANIARATIEGGLWSLAYGCRRCGLRLARSAGSHSLGARPSRLRSERSLWRSSGYRSLLLEPFESVAVGAAKQAAWALSGTMLDWPVPYASEQEPTAEDVAAAQEINARYESVLRTHFLRAGE